MDTIETQEPVGVEGATSPQDTSQVDTQPAETTPETVSDGTTEKVEAEKAPLLAGKYKSPEELEKAYKELDSKLGDLGPKAKVAEIIKTKYGLTPEQFEAQVQALEQEQKRQQYADNPLAPIVDEVAQLKQIVQQQESEKALMAVERELDEYVSKNPEYQPFRDKILKLGLTSEQDKTFEEIASEWFGQARSQGQQDAYKKIETKTKTQATSPVSTPPRKITVDDMKNMSSAEMEAFLPKSDRPHF